jgi:mycothiol synthase
MTPLLCRFAVRLPGRPADQEIFMPTQTLYQARPYTDADLAGVCDLLNACDAVDQQDDNYSLDDLRVEFDHPKLDKARDLRIWLDGAGQPAGFGQIWLDIDAEHVEGNFYWRVRPDSRNQGLEDALFAWATARLQEAGQEHGLPAQLRSGSREDRPYYQDFLAAQGLEIVRYFFTMARPLDAPIPDPQLPPGYTLRHSTPADVDAWVECFNQSFIDHWNHHPITAAEHAHWLTSEDYRPEQDLIAVAPDGTIAAFCFCGINREYNARNNAQEGWVHMLGTRRGHRQLGLGRAMLLAGLHRLRADGMAVAKLGVDAENPSGALGLYERTGFTRADTWISYSKDL